MFTAADLESNSESPDYAIFVARFAPRGSCPKLVKSSHCCHETLVSIIVAVHG